MGRISKSIQDRLHKLARDRVMEDEKVRAELDLSEEDYNMLLNRATLKCLRGLGIVSGYHIFLKEWYEKNKGADPLKSTKEVAASWRTLSKEEQDIYNERSKDRTPKSHTLNPSQQSRALTRNKYCEQMMSLIDLLSIECGLECVMFIASSLKGEQYAGMLGSSKGTRAAKRMNLDDKFIDYQVQLHHDLLHRDLEPSLDANRARTFISKTLNDLFKKAGGKGKLQFKNWDTLKRRWDIEIIGWPADVPLVAACKLKVEERRTLINALQLREIKFVKAKSQ